MTPADDRTQVLSLDVSFDVDLVPGGRPSRLKVLHVTRLYRYLPTEELRESDWLQGSGCYLGVVEQHGGPPPKRREAAEVRFRVDHHFRRRQDLLTLDYGAIPPTVREQWNELVRATLPKQFWGLQDRRETGPLTYETVDRWLLPLETD